jgi:creatinine amidohydrolase
MTYHYAPAFLEYPGSASLSLTTARDLTADVARSLAGHGPRRYYVLNTGLSPRAALEQSAKLLAAEGILLRFTDARALLDPAARGVQRQLSGRHADEIETSMILQADPSAVDMDKAVRQYGPPPTPFRLTRRPGGAGLYSPSGVWGDPTLATRDKGLALLDALVTALVADVEELRRAPLPAGTPAGPGGGARTTSPARGSGQAVRIPEGCLAGDDRIIRGLGPAFYTAWMNQDAVGLSLLWTTEGDMVHPDGFVERTAQVIQTNRASLFRRPEYAQSRHTLTIGRVRCLTPDVAVADARWELRGVTDDKRQPVPAAEGLCTLVLRKGAGWHIEAYRYSMNPQAAAPPTFFQRPGLPGR